MQRHDMSQTVKFSIKSVLEHGTIVKAENQLQKIDSIVQRDLLLTVGTFNSMTLELLALISQKKEHYIVQSV
jgi:hypothetical protein